MNGNSKAEFTFMALLKDCAKKKDIYTGSRVHADILNANLLPGNSYLASALISMYAKCGLLAKAQEVFEELFVRNVFTWSALISGYVQHGQGYKALQYLDKMQSEGLSPDAVTFTSVLKACGIVGAVEKGEKIHEEIVNNGMFLKDVKLGTALVDMYAKFEMFAKAEQVFEEMPVRNTVSWNVLIAGYTQHGQCCKALDCFQRLQCEALSADRVTLIFVLKSCKDGNIRMGNQIHCKILNRSSFKMDTVIGTALVDMYVKCGVLTTAQQVLEELPIRDVVAWSTLIEGYSQSGQAQEALHCFEQMQSEGISPDTVNFVSILKACSNAGIISIGEKVHNKIVSNGMLAKDIVLGTALVNMYVKCGMLTKAREVFEELPEHDTVSWSVLITGYAEQGLCKEAISCFECMQSDGLCPDVVAFLSILKACGSTTAIDKGEQIHNQILSNGFLDKDIMVGNALVDMYAKCGLLAKARQVLAVLPGRDVVSWNSLIAGYAKQKRGTEALICYEQMQKDGLSPDEVTFLCVLNACSHSELLDEPGARFSDITKRCGIIRDIDHHNCMVMAFGCAGDFDNAMSVIQVMPFSSNPTVWLAVLSACKKWGNVKLGKMAFDQAIQLDYSFSAAYVLMANIFEAAGMQEEARTVEAMRLQYAVCSK